MQYSITVGKKTKWALVGAVMFLAGSIVAGVFSPNSNYSFFGMMGFVISIAGLFMMAAMLVIAIKEDFEK